MSAATVLVGMHSVMEALRSGRVIEQVHVQQGGERRLSEIIEHCRRAGIAVRHDPKQALDRLAQGAVHQGVVAIGGGHGYADLDRVLEKLAAPGLLVALDGVEDPHNLGAVIRTAHAAGAAAVIIPERRAAGLTPVAAKAAAGALEYVPVCRVTNLGRTLDQLKERSYWVIGMAAESPSKDFREIDYRGGCIIVLGAEGSGLHRLVKEKCDWLASIPMSPMAGPASSLNVSVAAGVVLFEAQRQRNAK